MPRRNRREVEQETLRRTPRDANRRHDRQGRGIWQNQDARLSGMAAGDAPLAVETGRTVGIDFGLRRVGVAVSDPAGRIAHGLDTVVTAGLDDSVAQVVDVAERYQARRIVVGLPYRMNGDEGDMAQWVHEFVRRLAKCVSAEVDTWDERLTSAEAQRAFTEMGYRVKGNKKRLDQMAATLLLQSFLDRQRRNSAAETVMQEETCQS